MPSPMRSSSRLRSTVQSWSFALQRTLAALQFAEAKVLGLILSDSKTLAKQGYGKYGKYGKYGYGNK